MPSTVTLCPTDTQESSARSWFGTGHGKTPFLSRARTVTSIAGQIPRNQNGERPPLFAGTNRCTRLPTGYFSDLGGLLQGKDGCSCHLMNPLGLIDMRSRQEGISYHGYGLSLLELQLVPIRFFAASHQESSVLPSQYEHRLRGRQTSLHHTLLATSTGFILPK